MNLNTCDLDPLVMEIHRRMGLCLLSPHLTYVVLTIPSTAPHIRDGEMAPEPEMYLPLSFTCLCQVSVIRLLSMLSYANKENFPLIRLRTSKSRGFSPSKFQDITVHKSRPFCYDPPSIISRSSCQHNQAEKRKLQMAGADL